MKHPDYTLITKRGIGFLGQRRRNPRIFRLEPNKDMPAGYTEVNMIDGKSVYDERGRLKTPHYRYRVYTHED